MIELSRGAGSPERWVGAPPDAGESLRTFAARLRTRWLPADGLALAVRAQEALERATPCPESAVSIGRAPAAVRPRVLAPPVARDA